VYQISLNGFFETENPDALIEAIQNVVKEQNAELIGQFLTYGLSPYVDYQKADVTDP
jgi:hypothetical protein